MTEKDKRLLKELQRKYKPRKGALINSPDKLLSYLRALNLHNEVYVAVFLDSQLRVLGTTTYSDGCPTLVRIPLRAIVATAFDLGASNLLVAHNHPSGRCVPSGEDRNHVRMLRELLPLLDISLLDAFVVTDTNHVSVSLVHT